MIRKTTFFLLGFIFLSVSGMAQKVKYKDLFLLLNAKDYQKAEPFLKKYLKENDENPNAFLFMGFIYQEKSEKNDVLTQQEPLFLNIDSALIYYSKVLKTITEKEIK